MPLNVREFSLPDYEELTKEQDQIIRWDRKGKKVVIGGPGTGKTTIALILSKKIKESFSDVSGLLLMYNRALRNMSSQLRMHSSRNKEI